MSGNLTKLAVATTVAGATIMGLGHMASAHDFSLKVNGPTCVDGRKVATIPVVNGFDMHATVRTAAMSGGYADLAPKGTFTITESRPGTTTGTTGKQTVRVEWDDGVTVDHYYEVKWGDGTCGQTPTTPAPTTTVPGCPEGQHYSGVPPVGCYPDTPTTVPTEPPVTNPTPSTTVKVCQDGNAPSIPVEDGSVVCPEYYPTTTTTTIGAPVIVVRHATPTPTRLPATGASENAVIAAGLGLLAVGGVLLFVRRRAS